MPAFPRFVPGAIAVALTLVGCGFSIAATGSATATDSTATTNSTAATSASGADDGFELVEVRVVERRPHDPTAFTQGLEFDGERLYESRGQRSDDEAVPLTEIDPDNGSGLREASREDSIGDYFAEGLSIIDDRLIQLTFKSNTALVYDVDTFDRIGEFRYEGQGWGLCDQPDRLIMSNGTSTLTHRDPESFDEIDRVTVTLGGTPVEGLNELECVDDLVWANVWKSNRILAVDPDTGQVVAVATLSELATAGGHFAEDPESADVLNGIAFDSRTDTWLVTGKHWPWMYELDFTCERACP